MQSCRKIKITKVNDEIVEMKCSGFDMTEKEIIVRDVPNYFKGKYEDVVLKHSVIKMLVYFLWRK